VDQLARLAPLPVLPTRFVESTPTGELPIEDYHSEVVPAAMAAAGAVSFADFYRVGRDRIARALTLTLGDQDLAIEAVDEAMARAYQRWSRVGGLDNPGGWVYRVALNWASSVLRRRRRAPAPRAERHHSDIGPVSEPAILRALADLDVRQRAVVVCRHLLAWSVEETAIALSTPVGTVKSRLHRANRILASRLAHLRDEDER
jgi:RNA polymerase sigma-70 factor (ECF subfamily)